MRGEEKKRRRRQRGRAEQKEKMWWEQQVRSRDMTQVSSCAPALRRAGQLIPGAFPPTARAFLRLAPARTELRAGGSGLWSRGRGLCATLSLTAPALPVVPGMVYLGPGLVNCAMMKPRGRWGLQEPTQGSSVVEVPTKSGEEQGSC